jgi:NTE family protein
MTREKTKDPNGKVEPLKGKRRKINVALQGGGAHGAFTWGVLDRLLEDGRFEVEGISGTSAGAMNAVCLVDGFHTGKAEGARARLKQFWDAIGDHGRMAPPLRTPFDMWLGNWSVAHSPLLLFENFMRSFFSPYELNPFDVNPLKNIVEEVIEFNNVRACDSLKLFIAATNVWNGKVRVFTNGEIDVDTVMASACLPTMFKAVEVDGVPYWDGGYMGNPVLFPFFYETATDDLLLIQINPIERLETPKTSQEISNRVDEITFNASLLREFRAIDFVKRLIAQGKLSKDDYRDIRVHRIEAPEELIGLSAATKMNAEPEFLGYLFDLGRRSASQWLEGAAQKVGHEPGVDLADEIGYGLAKGVPEFVGERARKELEAFVRHSSAA